MMSLFNGAPRIHFEGDLKVSARYLDLSLKSTENSLTHIIQVPKKQPNGRLVPSDILTSPLSFQSDMPTNTVGQLTFSSILDEFGPYYRLQISRFEAPGHKSGIDNKLQVQSHTPAGVRASKRYNVDWKAMLLHHDDIIYVGDSMALRIDLSLMEPDTNKPDTGLGNDVVVPSSDQESEVLHSASANELFSTPMVDMTEKADKVDETPAVKSEGTTTAHVSASFSIQHPGHSDAGEVGSAGPRGRKQIKAVVDDSDPDMDVSVSDVEPRRKRSFDTELEQPVAKKQREERLSPPARRGRPKTKPSPTPENDTASPVSSTGRVKSEVPDSSTSSRASKLKSERPSTRYRDKIKVAKSGISDPPRATKQLLERFMTITDTVDKTTKLLCVGNGELKATIKTFKALALGIPIVSEKWLTAIAAKKDFVSHEKYIARDRPNETLWKAPQDWSAGGKCRSNLFQDFMITTTEELKASYGTNTFKQWKEVCALMGAQDVVSVISLKGSPKSGHRMIYLAAGPKDKLVAQLKKAGTTVYSKDLLSASIFRGYVNLESDEFAI